MSHCQPVVMNLHLPLPLVAHRDETKSPTPGPVLLLPLPAAISSEPFADADEKPNMEK